MNRPDSAGQGIRVAWSHPTGEQQSDPFAINNRVRLAGAKGDQSTETGGSSGADRNIGVLVGDAMRLL